VRASPPPPLTPPTLPPLPPPPPPSLPADEIRVSFNRGALRGLVDIDVRTTPAPPYCLLSCLEQKRLSSSHGRHVSSGEVTHPRAAPLAELALCVRETQLWEAKPPHTTDEIDTECVVPTSRLGFWPSDDNGGIPRWGVQLDNPLYEREEEGKDEVADDALVAGQGNTFSHLARQMSTKRWFFDV
jgi:hypothetical protein